MSSTDARSMDRTNDTTESLRDGSRRSPLSLRTEGHTNGDQRPFEKISEIGDGHLSNLG
jgi:hypothetical protein